MRPQRRTPKRKYKDYTKYKPWLREDFAFRCGYCAIHENQHGGYWHFHVDHHRPKGRREFRHLETVYSNLLYSCDHCNNLKTDSWPSDHPLDDGVGWLDPCDHDLTQHYRYEYRDQQFDLVMLTPVGRWMAISLALDQPARIHRRRALAEEEWIDNATVKKLETLLELEESLYKEQPTDDHRSEVAKTREVLGLLREKIENRYTPEPFVALHRRSQHP